MANQAFIFEGCTNLATKNSHFQQCIIPYAFVLQNINLFLIFTAIYAIIFFILMIRNSLAISRNQNPNVDSTNYDNYDKNNFAFSNYSDDNGDVTTP